MPEDLGAVLTSPDYWKYLKADGTIFPGLEDEYKAFKWFLKNALFCVNFELTGVLAKEVKDLGYKDFISKVYTVSDEAFAILVILNYEQRWRNVVEFPTKERSKLSTDKLYQCKWTNCQKGYAHMTWDKEGIDTYNDLVTNISGLREDKLTGYKLEARVKADFEELKKPRGRGKKKQTIESRPVMGGALREKLAALRNK